MHAFYLICDSLLASCISFCWIVTHFAWIAQRLVPIVLNYDNRYDGKISSLLLNKLIKNASAASCIAPRAPFSNWISGIRLCERVISRTSQVKGALGIRRSVVNWYLLMSRSVTAVFFINIILHSSKKDDLLTSWWRLTRLTDFNQVDFPLFSPYQLSSQGLTP